jgi:diguanylate cyclase (GGDEF)-like protein
VNAPLSSDSSGGRFSIGKPQSLTWWLLGISVALLVGQALSGFVVGRTGPWELALSMVTVLLVGSAVLNARASGIQGERRNYEAESFSRILRALSRSVSPDAVVEAIVHELGATTGADHVAVVRMRPGGAVLDVTFVSMLPGAATSNTVMPVRQLEPVETRRLRALRRQPGGTWTLEERRAGHEGKGLGAEERPVWVTVRDELRASGASRRRRLRPRNPALDEDEANARDVADRIAYRLGDVYGLRNTLAAPLEVENAIVGAIVLSRRTDTPWAESAARVLHAAAAETSAALLRVLTYQAAEVDARTDQLTQLPNRRYFDEYCKLLSSRRRASDRVAVLAVDVDHFKRFNDVYGHPVGDQVLRSIGNAIQTAVREEDVPARYGGEEFVVLLRNPTHGVALEIGERIRTAVRDMNLAEIGVSDQVTVSIGVASGHPAGEAMEDVVERADRALYAAKRTGRDRVVEAWPGDTE